MIMLSINVVLLRYQPHLISCCTGLENITDVKN